MKINIKADHQIDGEVDIVLSNDCFDNQNYIELTIGDESYDVPIEELYHAVTAFHRIKKERDEQEWAYEYIRSSKNNVPK